MATRVIDRMGPSGVAPAGLDRGEPCCPECGQSLNLRRGPDGAPPRSTAVWRPLAVVGLCLVLLFGIRTWQARGALASLDREIADRRADLGHDVFVPPSAQAMLQAEAIEPLLPGRAPLQRRLQGDLTGLALGLIGLVAGAGPRRGPLLRPVGPRRRGNV